MNYDMQHKPGEESEQELQEILNKFPPEFLNAIANAPPDYDHVIGGDNKKAEYEGRLEIDP